VLVYQVQQRLIRWHRMLLLVGADDHGGRGEQGRVAAGFHPCVLDVRAVGAERFAGFDLADPGP
jgi:hypothetical protein